jgi:hypothetical protein
MKPLLTISIVLIFGLNSFGQQLSQPTHLRNEINPIQVFDTANYIARLPHYCTLKEAVRKIKKPMIGSLIRVGEQDLYVYNQKRKWQKVKR